MKMLRIVLSLLLWVAFSVDASEFDDTKARAELGHPKAQYNLGVMYGHGEGVTQDYKLAHMWWNLAAASGDQDAVKNRGIVAKT